MHPYSTNESRVAVYAGLAVPAVALAWLIVKLTSSLEWPEWLVSAPSLATTFALVYALFDRWAWKWPLLSRIGIVGIADVSGTYEGTLTSNFQDDQAQNVTKDFTIEIRQTWTKIEICMAMATQSSTSRSQSAVASVGNQAGGSRLLYMYRNQISPAIADEDMSDHDGAADIVISADGELTGRYFNARPRKGSLRAKRVSKP